jgi:hypothetical protein
MEAAAFLPTFFLHIAVKMGIRSTTVGADQENTSSLHDMMEPKGNQAQGLLCIPTWW